LLVTALRQTGMYTFCVATMLLVYNLQKMAMTKIVCFLRFVTIQPVTSTLEVHATTMTLVLFMTGS